MNGVSMRCLGEFLPDKSTVIYKITSNIKEIRVRLFDPNGYTVYNKVDKIILIHFIRKIIIT
jgi:hypothetical protein